MNECVDTPTSNSVVAKKVWSREKAHRGNKELVPCFYKVVNLSILSNGRWSKQKFRNKKSANSIYEIAQTMNHDWKSTVKYASKKLARLEKTLFFPKQKFFARQ